MLERCSAIQIEVSRLTRWSGVSACNGEKQFSCGNPKTQIKHSPRWSNACANEAFWAMWPSQTALFHFPLSATPTIQPRSKRTHVHGVQLRATGTNLAVNIVGWLVGWLVASYRTYQRTTSSRWISLRQVSLFIIDRDMDSAKNLFHFITIYLDASSILTPPCQFSAARRPSRSTYAPGSDANACRTEN